MILSEMTAAELIDFRCCCKAFNAFFLANESAIVRGILNNHYYRTASKLYGAVSALGPRRFRCLKDIDRRCYIVEMLETSIAEHCVGQGFATTMRMGKNIRPYLLSLGHFFEEYRKILANYPDDLLEAPSCRTSGARVEGDVLKANYNEQTVQRICLTYKILNQIIDQKFVPSSPDPFPYRTLPYRLIFGAVPAGMFTHGGLEMIKDIVTHPRFKDRLKYTASHLARMTPAPIPVFNEESFGVALPPSVLGPRLSLATTLKIRKLGPFSRPMLQLRDTEVYGFPRVGLAEEQVMERDFLEYLKSYDGDEPKLVL